MKTIVIGGGVMGLCAALCLRRHGAEITVLEKRYCGAGASGRSGAILRQHYSNPLTVAMARDGLRVYADFVNWAGGSSGFVRSGCLILADARARAALAGNVRLMQDAGCRAEVLEPHQIREVAPMLAVGAETLGAWEPDAGYCDPLTVLTTLELACRQEGVILETGAPVTKIQTAHGKVTGVETDAGQFTSDSVLCCAGPWTNHLLEPLGVSVPIQNTRPLLTFFARPLSLPHHPVVGDLTGEIYFRPDESRTLVGALDLSHDDPVPDPDTLDETVPAAFVRFCRERVTARMPEIENGFGRGGYAGIYDCTPDMHPVLGAVPEVSGLYLAAGFSGHGFKLAPVVGQGLAELMVKGMYETLDLSPLAPTRYAENAPIRASYEYGLLA
ncbi:MAG: FAD-binding oxidoreductase [Armatimonadaceae bacterium]